MQSSGAPSAGAPSSVVAQLDIPGLDPTISSVLAPVLVGAPAPDIGGKTSQPHGSEPVAPVQNRAVRSELAPDGSVSVFKRVEIKMPNGDLYVGETMGGKREGRGTYYYINGDAYVGEFKGDVFHGTGVLRKATFSVHGRACVGRCYQGSFREGVRSGRGKYLSGFGDTYEGSFLEDCFSGEGSMVYANGDRYEGSWLRGRRDGRGVLVHANGDTYEGGFRGGEYHGDGVLRYANGQGSYSGGWHMGCRHGIGKRTYASAAEYEGEFERDVRSGRGVFKSSLGDLYVGSFADDRFSGEGTLVLCGGDRYQGQFLRGRFCGVGRYEWESGGYYEGEYLAQVRLGPPAPDKTFSPPDPWYWRAWAENVRTHVYDPITGELLSVRGRRVKDGKYLALSPDDEPVEAEVLDWRDVKPRTRLAQAEAARAKRRARVEADKRQYEVFLGNLGGKQRERAMERWAKRHAKNPEDFSPPIVVGTETDAAFVAAGGRGDSAVGPAADGKRHGRGVRVWVDGSRYEGEWFQDAQHGFGVHVGAGPVGARYEGEWREGRRHGAGVESYGHTLGEAFRCPLGNTHKTPARCFYDGGWAGGYYEGEGTFTCCDGRQYFGAWKHGKRCGFGRWVMLPAQLQYAPVRGFDGAPLLQGLTPLEGDPLLRDPIRARVYEGYFVKNKRAGLARQTLNNGDVWEGFFINGRLHGIGRMTFSSGRVVFAWFDMGKRTGWIRGKDLKPLQDGWEKDVQRIKEEAAEREASLKLLVRANAFNIADAFEEKLDREQHEQEKMDRLVAAQAFAPKVAEGAGVAAGWANDFSGSTTNRR